MFSGGCNCGAVRYDVDTDPLAVVVCHCSRCRNQSGSAFSVNLVVAESAMQVTGALTVFADGDSSSGQPVSRQFCGSCGSPIRSMPAANPGIAVIKAGTADQPGRFVPTMHVWTQSKLPWADVPDGLPAFAQNPGNAG